MTELETKIKMYADAYYTDGSSPISDEEFDGLIAQLKLENPHSILLEGITGDDLKGVSKKYKLPCTMGTLSKCMDIPSFEEKWKTVLHDDYVIEMKMDGVSTLLEYKDGNFVFAYSRGNAFEAEDLTANVSKINFPKKIENFTGHIRAEILMKFSTFNESFKDSAKNPRNMASGIIKRLDGTDCDKLSIVAYDVFDDDEKVDATELSKIEFLMNAGFIVPPIRMFNPPYETIINTRNNLMKYGFDYPCDGLVFKQNKVDKEDLQRKTPLYNFAIKPEPTLKISRVRDIVWQLQGSIFSPVAIFDPVDIDGTMVERASLSNISIMEDLGVQIGSLVEVTKNGMIIPGIVRVL